MSRRVGVLEAKERLLYAVDQADTELLLRVWAAAGLGPITLYEDRDYYEDAEQDKA